MRRLRQLDTNVTDDGGTIGKFNDDTETKHTRNASGRVYVKFAADGATFRLPPTFAASRGGQYSFSAVELTDRLIVGRTRGLLGQTKAATIDRQTGEITLEFAGAIFSGVCEKAVETPAIRKF